MNKQSALANMLIFLGPPIMGMFATLLLAGSKAFVMSIFLIGFALMLVAKYSQFKKGKWVSFGSKSMKKPFKQLYWWGWGLMGLVLLFVYLRISNA